LLFRLFHEDGVRVYETTEIRHECRCDVERVRNIVRSLPEEDQAYIIKDGRIEMQCEFCSKVYKLHPDTLDVI